MTYLFCIFFFLTYFCFNVNNCLRKKEYVRMQGILDIQKCSVSLALPLSVAPRTCLWLLQGILPPCYQPSPVELPKPKKSFFVFIFFVFVVFVFTFSFSLSFLFSLFHFHFSLFQKRKRRQKKENKIENEQLKVSLRNTNKGNKSSK